MINGGIIAWVLLVVKHDASRPFFIWGLTNWVTWGYNGVQRWGSLCQALVRMGKTSRRGVKLGSFQFVTQMVLLSRVQLLIANCVSYREPVHF